MDGKEGWASGAKSVGRGKPIERVAAGAARGPLFFVLLRV